MPRLLLAALLLSNLCCLSHGQRVEKSADAPRPKSPQESAKCFRLPPGFELTLLASEPVVVDPTCVAWDANGHIYVCELHGYNLEGHIDVAELNQTGQLDRKVRRIEAEDWAKQAAAPGVYGTVKRLRDTDGDGLFDASEIWADRLPPCYGLVAARDGLIVTCAPHILFLADRDGDGTAEVQEQLFTGFGRGKLERGINNPRWSFDNWIYVSSGGGGQISGPNLRASVKLGSSDFRFRADGSALEPITGANHTFGAAMTDDGQRFLITGGSHALYATPLPYEYLLRNPFVATPRTTVNAADYSRVYPISKPHPWRQQRGADPNWIKFYGATEATPNGNFTSACGQLIYRDHQFPTEYHNNHFSCDPQQSLIHRCIISNADTEYRVRRPAPNETTEFLSSSDGWFKPNNLLLGPDGSIYIVDMYREIIEDYSAIPRYLQQQYGLDQGNDRGRIWKLSWRDAAVRERPALQDASTHELVRQLDHDSAWWRLTAQRRLLERRELTAIGPLRETLSADVTWQAKLHALYTLRELEALEPSDIAAQLDSPHFGLRMHAIKLSEPWLDSVPAVFQAVIARRNDPDARVRLQLALTLGESKQASAAQTLVELATNNRSVRWMPAAIVSSIADQPTIVLRHFLDAETSQETADSILSPIASTIGAKRDAKEVDQFLALLHGRDHPLIESLTAGLIQGLGRSAPKFMELDRGGKTLADWISKGSADRRSAALQISGELLQNETAEIQQVFSAAAQTTLDRTANLADRAAALELIKAASFATLRPVLEAMLTASEPPQLQRQAIRIADQRPEPEIAQLLISAWPNSSPQVQAEIATAVLHQRDRLPQLLIAIEEERIPSAALTAFQRLLLLDHPEASIRQRARECLDPSEPEDSSDILSEYLDSLAEDRDPGLGQQLFAKHCQSCHRVENAGHDVGPPLAGERNRADETLVRDILTPSATIASGYATYSATTLDGRVISGVLSSESATSITLRQQEGKEETLLRNNLEAIHASSVSLMPADLSKQLSPTDVRNLIGFLRQQFGARATSRKVLFADAAGFVGKLEHGQGQARIDSRSPFQGENCLVISPKQRYANQIDDWTIPIREEPQQGQFRYLRLAWKSMGAHGLMIELADRGKFPENDKPNRSYHAGNNDTGWASNKLASTASSEWTVITIDLWRDNGDFTLTGLAFTVMGGDGAFDSIELWRSLESLSRNEAETSTPPAGDFSRP